jgi:hypothetical protein
MILGAKIFLVTWFITSFEPLQLLADVLYKRSRYIVTDFILEVFTCWKCLSLWAVLILTQDVFISLFFSLVAYVIERGKGNI